jgi:DNA repair exonuclease SbcCD ATPase subunit
MQTQDQLALLRSQLQEKTDNLKIRIDQDEATKEALLKELKAVTGKLEEVERRLFKLTAARKEYTKTLQETVFALEKIEACAEQMQGRFRKMDDLKGGTAMAEGTGVDMTKSSIHDFKPGEEPDSMKAKLPDYEPKDIDATWNGKAMSAKNDKVQADDTGSKPGSKAGQ